MATGPDDVRFQGKTRSSRPTTIMTRLTCNRRRGLQTSTTVAWLDLCSNLRKLCRYVIQVARRRDLPAASFTIGKARGMFTFRTSITFAVMAFIVALTALLIAIHVRALHCATQEAASAYMDATSTKAFGRLQAELTAITSLVTVLATSSSVADSNE